jgi:hypothetical protein
MIANWPSHGIVFSDSLPLSNNNQIKHTSENLFERGTKGVSKK